VHGYSRTRRPLDVERELGAVDLALLGAFFLGARAPGFAAAAPFFAAGLEGFPLAANIFAVAAICAGLRFFLVVEAFDFPLFPERVDDFTFFFVLMSPCYHRAAPPAI
jgi:hypothetical protein